MILRTRNDDRGFFIGGAEIACFIIINLMMLASFGLGSSIRKTQDAKYLAIQLEERRKQEEAEAARQRLIQERAARERAQASKKDQPKIGAIEQLPGQSRHRNYNTSIVSSPPDQFKKVVPAKRPAPSNEPAKTPNEKKATAVKPAEGDGGKTGEVKTTAAASPPKDTNETEAAADESFAERISSLFFSDIDSLGVDLYDYKLARHNAGKEIAILRLFNALKLEPAEETTAGAEYHLSVSTTEVALKSISGKIPGAPENSESASQAENTSEASIKKERLVAKFLYRYKDTTYVATNAGLYSIANDRISEIKEGEKARSSKIEKFMHNAVLPCDIIAMEGDGEFLFVATPSTIYLIDLSTQLATDIGVDELFENSDWYCICYFAEKLYLANAEALFYYDAKLAKWFTVPYEKFAGIKKCRIQSLIVYQNPGALSTNYMLITRDQGIITDKMPPFDPAALKHETVKFKPKILKKIFERDLLKCSPAFVYNEPGSIWFSFEPYAKDAYELIRFDKKNEKYERFNFSEKLKCVYAIDISLYNENLMFAVNGEDLFAIIKMWGDNDARVYGFLPIASISGCFSVTHDGKYIICGTLDGQIYKIDASDIIKSVEKL